MKYHQQHIELAEPHTFIEKALYFANSFSHFQYLNPNRYTHGFVHELSFGVQQIIIQEEELKHHLKRSELRGFFSYDYKNKVETLHSTNPILQDTPDFAFFIPQHILTYDGNKLCIQSITSPDEILHCIHEQKIPSKQLDKKKIKIEALQCKEEYIRTVNSIKQQIEEGIVYELCHCMPFKVNGFEIDPIQYYYRLNTLSPTPFSALQKFDNEYLLCASPERFLQKKETKVISQPIKGTIRRGQTAKEDEALKQALKHSEKERAENLMIVDLVRNDIAKSAIWGTTKVDELFGIYSFQHLHQMISTISGEVKEDFSLLQLIKNAFPMGSMTGAPKIKAMELIEQYEVAKRGLYSGTVGYITKDGDFDFNVVIRSISYAHDKKEGSFFVGSAITYDSDPIYEYNECMLKASAIFELLTEV